MAVHTAQVAVSSCSSSPQVRASVVDWMSSTAGSLQLPQQALFLGVRLLDRLLSGPGAQQLGQPKLGLVACACLAVASKFEQASSPPLRAYLPYLSAAACLEQLKSAELLVLSSAGFRLQGLAEDTTHQHLATLLQQTAAAGAPGPWHAALSHLAHYLAEVTLLEVHLLPMPACQVAAACLVQACAMLGASMPDAALTQVTGCKLQQLVVPMAWVAAVQATLCAAARNGRPYAATRKYLPGLCSMPVPGGAAPGVLWACAYP